jgi:molybdenum-dependent DNA-binding transcriptional regulator ModE
MERKARRRAKVRRFTAERRAQFLEHLRRTGNQGAAAKAVGIHRDNVEKRRKRDAEFAIACMAAEEEASQRLAGARDPFDGVEDARFETIRRGRKGRWQIVATRKGKWSKAVENMFFDVLRTCGNIAASARAVGFSEGLIWQRRRAWPGFRQRMEETLEEAGMALEFQAATWGNNLAPPTEDEEKGTAKGNCPPPPPPPFDPDFALRFLKWREEKRRGGGQRGRRAYRKPEPTIEEVRDEILKRIAAIRRHREKYGKPEPTDE